MRGENGGLRWFGEKISQEFCLGQRVWDVEGYTDGGAEWAVCMHSYKPGKGESLRGDTKWVSAL